MDTNPKSSWPVGRTMKFSLAAALVLLLSFISLKVVRSGATPDSPRQLPPTSPGPGSGSDTVNTIGWGDPDGGNILAASIALDQVTLPAEQAEKLSEAAFRWFTAYQDNDPARCEATMLEFGISVPSSWQNSTNAKDLWNQRMHPLRGIRFDPAKTRVQSFRFDELDRPVTRVERCGRRDSARPFLREIIKPSGVGVEIIVVGAVTDPESKHEVPVSMAFDFAWRSETKQWVLIQTCLRDFPNAYFASPPML